MHVVTRNNAKNKRGKDLLMFFEGRVFLSFKNAKILLGYSPKTGNEVITSKVSEENISKKCEFSKKGNKIVTCYLKAKGIEELINSIKQKDKKQNGVLAINMINEAIDEVLREVYKVTNQDAQDSQDDEAMINQIKNIVGDYNSENSKRWEKLYDELDTYLDESIRVSYRNYVSSTGEKITLLRYIQKYTKLLPYLMQISIKLFVDNKQ